MTTHDPAVRLRPSDPVGRAVDPMGSQKQSIEADTAHSMVDMAMKHPAHDFDGCKRVREFRSSKVWSNVDRAVTCLLAAVG